MLEPFPFKRCSFPSPPNTHCRNQILSGGVALFEFLTQALHPAWFFRWKLKESCFSHYPTAKARSAPRSKLMLSFPFLLVNGGISRSDGLNTFCRFCCFCFLFFCGMAGMKQTTTPNSNHGFRWNGRGKHTRGLTLFRSLHICGADQASKS